MERAVFLPINRSKIAEISDLEEVLTKESEDSEINYTILPSNILCDRLGQHKFLQKRVEERMGGMNSFESSVVLITFSGIHC